MSTEQELAELREAVRNYLVMARQACSCHECQSVLRQCRAKLAELLPVKDST